MVRFAREMRPRLDLPCKVDLKHQSDFQEPRVRINTDAIDENSVGWDEARAWDEIAQYYKSLLKK